MSMQVMNISTISSQPAVNAIFSSTHLMASEKRMKPIRLASRKNTARKISIDLPCPNAK